MESVFCLYCNRPCGPLGFCDETCQSEYDLELRQMQDAVREDLPGETRHSTMTYWEPEEWDVVGGL